MINLSNEQAEFGQEGVGKKENKQLMKTKFLTYTSALLNPEYGTWYADEVLQFITTQESAQLNSSINVNELSNVTEINIYSIHGFFSQYSTYSIQLHKNKYI